ncbi:activated CDC42 kinase 1 [Brachionus plicatilis]|uniref:non-specific protein-tyrosine kinase n=1 Tax=Brachionus plicatilis TaxID=10195 RepID=A0A3M7SW84_BRAPC|nr:activated CDC42 kinase 1 [Brachionus plicatilis]
MDQESNEVYRLLLEIQLEKFWPKISESLQITRLSHFEYVKSKDLEKIGLSKPAIRRLTDAVNKAKKSILPSRPAPLPPNSPVPPELSNSNKFIRVLSKRKIVNQIQNGSTKSQVKLNGISIVINPKDIEICKNKTGEEIIGKGNFGIVKKGIWKSPNGQKITVAIKCLHENGLELDDSDKRQSIIDIVNEISCMCGLDHVNLTKLYGVIMNGSGDENSIISMVTELAPNGSLLKYLRQNRQLKNVPLTKLYSYIYQITDGMEYLEIKNLIHRDLAARNILLKSLDHVKICDFGMSRNAVNGHYTMNENHKIPCAWYPPESIREKIFSIKSDVWAFGVTVWEIFSFGDQPWPNLTAAQIYQKIDTEGKRLSIPYMCSREFYKIINLCWSKKPDERPSFGILKKAIKEFRLIEMKAKDNFNEAERLELERGDSITIIDGYADKYWWKGQNNRTLLTGSFPRAMLDAQRRLKGEDISLPLKNSFIHTGHMGADSKNVWGNPGKIDELFLSNPLIPPDLMGNEDDSNGEINNPKIESENSNSESSSYFDDLIGLFDDKFVISRSEPLTQPNQVSLLDIPNLTINQNDNQYQNQNYFKDMAVSLPNKDVYYQNEDYKPRYQNSAYQSFSKTNPFFSEVKSYQSLSQKFSNEKFLIQNDDKMFVYQENQNFNCRNSTQNFNSSSKDENLDDLLQKVMTDVFNDFKVSKFGSN